MPTAGCTSWFWISSGQLESWRPTRFSPHIWQESGKNTFQVFDASTFKTKLTMVTAQLVYTLITLVPVPFLFASYTVRLSTTHSTTLILNVQNFGSVFLRSNFWYQRNLRCYWQSQMLHRKIRITLASEVFHKKYYALPKHLRFLRALWYSYWMSHMYFDISKHRKRKW